MGTARLSVTLSSFPNIQLIVSVVSCACDLINYIDSRPVVCGEPEAENQFKFLYRLNQWQKSCNAGNQVYGDNTVTLKTVYGSFKMLSDDHEGKLAERLRGGHHHQNTCKVVIV
ncbi:hypothetical protein AVEN_141702-1 [Araneus ventricosus]|uniref:Uncharacterized protein n=1 Tax=Araneus ventricosus TaxID=182803 RepID=A0A4Y2JNJ8_ARAVE|nr:hypothetical protein AVEN_141702-1 [Araneus ventricosus]